MKYKEALELNTSHDEMRPEMQTPFIQDGGIHSTDAYTLLSIAVEAFPDSGYEERDKPSLSGVLPTNMNLSIPINIKKLEVIMHERGKLEKVYAVCSECSGDGGEICPCCENVSECEDCGGSGKSDKWTGEWSFMNLVPMKIGPSASLNQMMVDRLIATAKLLDCENIEMISGGDTNMPHLFNMNGSKFLLMPMMFSEHVPFQIKEEELS